MNSPWKVSTATRNATPPLCARSAFNASGFSLVEVLITALLIGIGMLGMAALQGRAIAYTTETVKRTTAAMLANDMLELVRATPDHWSRYLQAGLQQPGNASACRPTPAQPAAQLACWLNEVATLLPSSADLPNGTSHVCRAPTPGTCAASGSVVEVQVAWKGSHGECLGAETYCHHRIRSQL